mmetsp:Transcript_22464/g.33278  ORF Transcript_22464/g.33278 Transcript_22464/m.33278 type:complete len:87 (+) Transcript_22464:40-300(+)
MMTNNKMMAEDVRRMQARGEREICKIILLYAMTSSRNSSRTVFGRGSSGQKENGDNAAAEKYEEQAMESIDDYLIDSVDEESDDPP